jgi:hypothetical protein
LHGCLGKRTFGVEVFDLRSHVVAMRGPLTKLLRSGTHAIFLRFSKASIISITSLIPKDG